MERTSFGLEYSYLPRTYVFPDQQNEFESDNHKSSSKWITKPSNSSCGRDITVHRGAESALASGLELLGVAEEENHPHKTCVVSSYIDRPFMIHNHKFDCRLYAVVVPTQEGTLCAYLYHDSLVRFATSPYGEDGGDLTNYSINEGNAAFIEDNEDDPNGPISNQDALNSHKWSWQAALPFFPSSFDMAQANNILGKVAASATTTPSSSTYELIGIDVMFDEDGKLWLLEVQNRPSMLALSQLDRRIKSGLVDDVQELLEALQGSNSIPINWKEAVYKNANEARREAENDDTERLLFNAILDGDKEEHYRFLVDNHETNSR